MAGYGCLRSESELQMRNENLYCYVCGYFIYLYIYYYTFSHKIFNFKCQSKVFGIIFVCKYFHTWHQKRMGGVTFRWLYYYFFFIKYLLPSLLNLFRLISNIKVFDFYFFLQIKKIYIKLKFVTKERRLIK